MIQPPYLQAGSKVLVCGSARFTEPHLLNGLETLCKTYAWELEIDATVFDAHHQFAGDDEQRAAAVQRALERSDVAAILFARGGYGTIRIMEALDLSVLEQHPKWLMGFSDLTYLLNPCAQISPCLHGPMALQIGDDTASDKLAAEFLSGTKKGWKSSNCRSQTNGDLANCFWVGGNLSIVYAMLALPSFHIPENAVLFLEDLDEYLYHMDRMMASLYYSGKLGKFKAVMAGSFSDMNDHTIPFGMNASEILQHWCSKAQVELVEELPFGHTKTNYPIVLGSPSKIAWTHQGSFEVEWK